MNGSTEVCLRCPIGTFSASSGASECTACPDPRANTPFQGATSQEDCECREGSFLSFEEPGGNARKGGRCVPCQEGLVCPGGSQAPSQRGGYWVDVANSDVDRRVFSVIRCRNFLECPDGPLASCASGREGIGCGNCQDDHYKADDGRCDPCGGSV